MKLVGSLRGEGRLSTAEGEAPVRYQIDTFEERNRTSRSGSLTGDLSFAEDKSAGVLTLATGEAMDVILVSPDDEGADFQSNEARA